MFSVLTVSEAKALLEQSFPYAGTSEKVPLEEGLHRVLAAPVFANEYLPPFPRSTMDGYAVMAENTFGASESMPALLKVTGEVFMGELPSRRLEKGEAFQVYTGSVLPENADSVVMLEYTETLKEGELAVLRPVAPGENILARGDDFMSGEEILSSGHFIRPQDLGALAGMGVTELEVVEQPLIAIISTGDEIVDYRETPTSGQIRDINSTLIFSQIKSLGANPVSLGIVKDHEEELSKALERGTQIADGVVITGGTSVGARDVTVEAIECNKGGEILFHGMAVRPGKPSILGKIEGKPVCGLSGNPTSAMIGFLLLVKPYIRKLLGLPAEELFPREINAVLLRNLPSTGGREDYYRVLVYYAEEGWRAEPVFGPPGLTNTMVRSHGIVKIPQNSEGFYRGDEVKVYILE